MVDLAEASRRHPALLLGLSPRATLQLSRATRARAASQGREYATPDDVKAVAEPVLSHRVMLRPDAMSRGVTGISRHPRDRRLRACTRRSLMLTRHGWTAIVAAVAFVRHRAGLRPDRAVRARRRHRHRAARRGDLRATSTAAAQRQAHRQPGDGVGRRAGPGRHPTRQLGRQASPYLQLWEPVGNNGGAPMQLAKLGAGPGGQRGVPGADRTPRPHPHRAAARAAPRRARASPAHHDVGRHRGGAHRPAHASPCRSRRSAPRAGSGSTCG